MGQLKCESFIFTRSTLIACFIIVLGQFHPIIFRLKIRWIFFFFSPIDVKINVELRITEVIQPTLWVKIVNEIRAACGFISRCDELRMQHNFSSVNIRKMCDFIWIFALPTFISVSKTFFFAWQCEPQTTTQLFIANSMQMHLNSRAWHISGKISITSKKKK